MEDVNLVITNLDRYLHVLIGAVEVWRECMFMCYKYKFAKYLGRIWGPVVLAYMGVESGKIMAPRDGCRAGGRCTGGLFCLSTEVNHKNRRSIW